MSEIRVLFICRNPNNILVARASHVKPDLYCIISLLWTGPEMPELPQVATSYLKKVKKKEKKMKHLINLLI